MSNFFFLYQITTLQSKQCHPSQYTIILKNSFFVPRISEKYWSYLSQDNYMYDEYTLPVSLLNALISAILSSAFLNNLKHFIEILEHRRMHENLFCSRKDAFDGLTRPHFPRLALLYCTFLSILIYSREILEQRE